MTLAGPRRMTPASGVTPSESNVSERTMGIALVILIIAIIVGGIGLFIEALQLLLWIGLILLIAAFVMGFRARSSA